MQSDDRLHALDAVRGFALLLGVVFHGGFSFIPGMVTGIWAYADRSPSAAIAVVLFTSHIFRMALFFFIAGFFARLMFTRRGWRGFWIDRGKRIAIPMVVGWLLLFPSIAAVWLWGLRTAYGETLPPVPAALPPAPLLAFPLTHLWFLYYLLVLYALVALVRGIVLRVDVGGAIRRGVDVAVRRMVTSGAAAVLLAIPVALALAWRSPWVMWFGIPTPDRSLLPEWPSLVAYGSALAFGWLVHRQSALSSEWSRQWRIHLAAAVTCTVACLALAGVAPSLDATADAARRIPYAFLYSVALWCWVFAIIGIATRFFSNASRLRRYVADASYWIYLVHLPVVAALQVLVGPLPWHWSVKFPLILAAAFAVLFASYHLLVRFSPVGALLNGRRQPRRAASGHTAPPPTPAASEDAPLAELVGVRKRYGTTVALDGVDFRVGRGELVALLGPNGAGKSTAVGLLLGLIEPDAGVARLMGRSPLDVESRREIGVMMQEVALPLTLRVREQVALAASYYPHPLSSHEALAMTHTLALAERRYGRLSAGQKRQAQFAIAVCGRPRLLFLDEPTVGLDVHAREAMWQVMRELVAQGTSIVLTTHYLEEAEALADRVVVLANGRVIAEGRVEEIRSIVSRTHVSCTTTVAADDVRGWPGVVEATSEGGRLRVTARDAEDLVRRLLAADPSLRNLEVRQAGLGEAFTQLTREAA